MPSITELASIAAKIGARFKVDYSKFKYGIDVSKWNGDISFDEVKNKGILHSNGTSTKVDYVYIKMTEGVAGRDRLCGVNAAECHRLNISRGYYHYCTMTDKDEVRDAKAEAAYLIKRLSDLPPYQMPIALDVEDPKVILTDKEVEDWIDTFFGEITAAGHDDYVLYSYSPFLRERLPPNHKLGTVRLWAARYGGKFPDPVPGWSKIWAHQYSNVGKVAGIAGNVDLNVIL